jgi:hypothetical protein
LFSIHSLAENSLERSLTGIAGIFPVRKPGTWVFLAGVAIARQALAKRQALGG